ncbi:MAG: hypothetical protein R2836_00510 [Chitinophagales bacterium]
MGFWFRCRFAIPKNGYWRFGFMARDITSTYNAWSFSFTQEEADVLQATGNLVLENS